MNDEHKARTEAEEDRTILEKEIKARILAQQKLEKASRLYATLSQINQAIVRESDKQKLFQIICDATCAFGNFKLAWIGMVDQKSNRIEPVAYSGDGSDYLRNIIIKLDDGPTSKGPTATSIREKRSVIFNDLQSNPKFKPWRKRAIEKGYQSSAALPIYLNNKAIGAFNVYAVEAHFFDADEIKLLEEAAADISFALEQMRKAEQRKKTDEALRQSQLHYHALFEYAPIPIWEEDFSQVYKKIKKLKHEGVKDFNVYFKENPAKVNELAAMVKIIELNNAVLILHEAKSKEELLDGLPAIFTDESYQAFKQELIAIAEGHSKFQFEATVKTLKGNKKQVQLKWAAVPGYEKNLERIYISTIDITQSVELKNDLLSSQQKLNEAQHLAKIGDFTWNVRSGEVTWSEGMFELLKYDKDEKIDYSKVNQLIHHPEDLQRVTEWLQNELASGRKIISPNEYRLIRKDGKVITVHTEGNISYKNGKAVELFGMCQDITTRVENEKALQNHLNQISLILQTTMDGYILADVDGRLIDVNPAYCRLTGYDRSELLKMNIRQLEGRLSKEEVTRRIQEMTAKGRDRFETTHISKDGREIDIEVSISIMQQGNESPPLVAAFVRDISDRKRQQSLLLESEANKRSLINARQESIWSIDKDYCFLIFNQKFERDYKQVYGISIKKGLNALDILSPELKHFWKDKYERALSGGQLIFEFSENIENQLHYFSVALNPIILNKDCIGVSAISNDITEQKGIESNLRESEERFRLTFSTNPDAININRLEDGLYVDVNQGFCDITAYTREEVVGKSSLEINIWDNPQDRQKLVDELKRSGKVTNFEAQFRTKSGSLLTGLMSAAIIMLKEVPHIISITRNIEGLKQLEREREQLLTETENSRKLLDDVFSRIHDGVVGLDVGWHYTYLNEQAAKMLNREKPEDLLGKHIWTEYPEGIDQPFYKAYHQAMKTQEMVYLQEYYPPWDRWFENRIYPSPDGLTVYFTEITDAKKADLALQKNQAQFRNMFEYASIGKGISDTEGHFIRVNQCFADMLGYTRDALQAKSWMDVTHPEDLARGNKLTTDLISGTISHFTLEHRLLNSNGTVIWVSLNLVTIPGDNKIKTYLIGDIIDINERKEAERALISSERRLIEAQRVGGVGCWELDIRNDTLFWSDEVYTMLELSPTDFEGTFESFLSYVHPEDRDYVNTSYMDSLKNKTNYDIVHRIKMNDGRIKYIHERCETEYDADGTAIKSLGTIHDISEIKESETKFRNLFEISNDAIYVLYKKRFVLVNSKFSEIFGYSSDECRADDFDFMKLVAPESRQLIKSRMAEQSKDETLPALYEFIGQAKDGHKIICEVSVSQVEFEGGIASQGILRDITDRKQADQKLRQLVTVTEQSPIAIVITNTNGEIEYVNPRYEDSSGYLSSEVMGKNCNILKSGKTPLETYENLWATILAGKTWKGVFTNKRKNGELYYENATIGPIYDDKGIITHYVALKEDITEKRNLEQQLRQSQKMEAIGVLAGGVAHDFNNLITVINGYSELLILGMKKDNPAIEHLRQIQGAGRRASNLTRQLLAFIRKQIMKQEVMDVNNLVSEMEKMLHLLIGEDIDLVTSYDSDIDAIKADPGQIEQIILNLAVNSRDAMPLGGRLTIETQKIYLDEVYTEKHQEVTPGAYVMIAVSDTGKGMDKKTQARIFDPFFTTKEVGKGTGLGLSTVYGIVKQSKGYIWVYSEINQGTTFKIYFPVHKEANTIVKASSLKISTFLGNETLLIVEDDDALRELAVITLETFGYKIYFKSNGSDALKFAKKHNNPIDLLLTDVIMPHMGGPELARKIVAIMPTIKILYMSGYTSNAIVHHGVLDEKINLIQKPFNQTDLAKKIRDILDDK